MAKLMSAPVFRRFMRVTAMRSEPISAPAMSAACPATMPSGPAALARPEIKLAAHLRIGVRRGIGKNLEREGQQRSRPRATRSLRRTGDAMSGARAGDRRRPCTADRRGSANMYARTRSRQAARSSAPSSASSMRAGFQCEEWPQPLAAAERGVAHRFGETRFGPLGARQQRVERDVDTLGGFLQTCFEMRHRPCVSRAFATCLPGRERLAKTRLGGETFRRWAVDFP